MRIVRFAVADSGWFFDKCGNVRFRVYSQNPDAGWSRDWYWASQFDLQRPRQPLNQHGPYPFKLWAWLAARWATR